MLKALSKLFWSINRFSGYLSGYGAWKMRPLHRQLLDAFLPSLDADLRAVVERQIAQPFYMQFWNQGRINPFFFTPLEMEPALRIADPAFVDRPYKVELYVDGRKQHAHVTFFEGRIFSVEFKKPSKFYKVKEIRFGAVTLGKPKHSMGAVLDRYAHGRDDAHNDHDGEEA